MSTEQYQSLLIARRGAMKSAAVPEKFWKCLCCRDNGVLPIDVIERYLGDRPDLVLEAQLLGPSAVPLACTREDCEGNVVMVEVPMKDGDEEIKVLKPKPRFPHDSVDRSVPSSFCENIHRWEAQKINGEGSEEARKAAKQAVSTITSLVRSMPLAEPESEVIEIHEPRPPEMIDGFKVGDRVVLTLDRLDERERREARNGQELPREGECGVIQGFAWVSVLGAFLALIRFDDGSIDRLDTFYLQDVMEAAA